MLCKFCIIYKKIEEIEGLKKEKTALEKKITVHKDDIDQNKKELEIEKDQNCKYIFHKNQVC